MDLKKQHVLEVASELFVEKGYLKTSMQDIAEQCNISKATLYKFFNSKEGLGKLVIFFVTEQMLGKVDRITKREDLSPREIFRECIIVRMERFADWNQVIDEFLFSLAPEQRARYLLVINKNRFDIFRLFSDIIKEVFSLDSETAAAELAVNFNGLLKEITFVAGERIIELDERQVAEFIIDSLDAIREKRAGKKPLLTERQLQELRDAYENEEQMLQTVFRRRWLIQSLKNSLEDYEKNGQPASLKEAETLLTELKKIEQDEEAKNE